tara:strand:- start:4125 stop:4550 length:426 start_codon:yes stop_codon:yes gene_type:complete
MIPTEILTLFGGSITGFIFKFMAARSKDNQKKFEMLMTRNKFAEETRNAAAKRATGAAGSWVRRFIVISIMFGVILAPFIATLLSIPVVLEVDNAKPILFGLFGTRPEKLFVESMGYVLVPEIRQSLTAIIGFYFGQSTVK